jgi:hypothetical protein
VKKNFLDDKKSTCLASNFATDADLKEAVTSMPQMLGTDSFYYGLQALAPRWNEFLNVNGDCGVISANNMPCIRGQRCQNTSLGINQNLYFIF